tara:strand:+ start:4158 stop:7886 length:3729 start_codon:yes stop_codon:yes gene_type:complete
MKNRKKKAPGAYLKKKKVKKYQEGGKEPGVKDLLSYLEGFDPNRRMQVPTSDAFDIPVAQVNLPAAEVVTEGTETTVNRMLPERLAKTEGDLAAIYKELGSEGVDKYLDMTQGVVDAQNRAYELIEPFLYLTPMGTPAMLNHIVNNLEDYNPQDPEGALNLAGALATFGRGKAPQPVTIAERFAMQGLKDKVTEKFRQIFPRKPEIVPGTGRPQGAPSQSGMFSAMEEAATEAEFARTLALPGSQTPAARISPLAEQTFRRDDASGLAALTRLISDPKTKFEDLPRLAQSAITGRHASYDDNKPGYQIIRNALLARGYVNPDRDSAPGYTLFQNRSAGSLEPSSFTLLEDTRTWRQTKQGNTLGEMGSYNPWSVNPFVGSNKALAKNIQQIPLLIGDKFLNKVRKQKGTGLLEIESLKEQLNAKGVKEKDRALILDLVDNLTEHDMLPQEGYIDPSQLRGYIAAYYTDNRTTGQFFDPEDFLDEDGRRLFEDGQLGIDQADNYLNFKYSGYGMKNLGYKTVPVDGVDVRNNFFDPAGNPFQIQIYGVAAENPTLAPSYATGYLYESQEGHMGHVREILVTPKDGGAKRHYIVEIQSNALQKNKLPENLQYIEPRAIHASARPELDGKMKFLNLSTGLDAEAVFGDPNPLNSALWATTDPYSKFRQHGRIDNIPEMVEDMPHAYDPKYWDGVVEYHNNLLRKIGDTNDFGSSGYAGRRLLEQGTKQTREFAADELRQNLRDMVDRQKRDAIDKGFVTYLPKTVQGTNFTEAEIENHPLVEDLRVSREGIYTVYLPDGIVYVTKKYRGGEDVSSIITGDLSEITRVLMNDHWGRFSDKMYFARQVQFYGYIPVTYRDVLGTNITMFPDQVMAPLEDQWKMANLATRNASLDLQEYVTEQGQNASRLQQYLEMNDLNPPGTFTDARLQDSFDQEAEFYNMQSKLRALYEEVNIDQLEKWDRRPKVPKNNPEQKNLLKNKTQFMLTEYLTDLIGTYAQGGSDARIFVPTPETAASVQGFYMTTAYNLASARARVAEYERLYKEAEEGLRELRQKYGIKALEPRFIQLTSSYSDPISHDFGYDDWIKKQYPRLTRQDQPSKGYVRDALPKDMLGIDRRNYHELIKDLEEYSTESRRVQSEMDRIADLEKTLEEQKKSGVKHHYAMNPDGGMSQGSADKIHFTVKAYADLPKVLKDMGITYKEHTDDLGNTWLELDLSAAQRIGAGTFKAYQRGGKVIKKSPFKLIKK